MKRIVQCVPNFSEGRKPEVMEAIVSAARQTAEVRIADWSGDPDHNRMVLTLVGQPEQVLKSVLAAADAAIHHIDLRTHHGAHPRLGAIDVLPFVPIKGVTMEECTQLAYRAGAELAKTHNLPVFYYEAAASGRTLPYVRKHAFVDLFPDAGPSDAPHPTAGAVVVGARNPLIAYNVELDTTDMKAARKIATELRDGGSAGISGVRTLALFLESKQRAQISMNVVDTENVSLHDLFRTICERCAELGIDVVGSEVIGAVPGYSAFQVVAEALNSTGLRPGQVLFENWPD